MMVAVIAVTATVGVGTWVLGSGADAAPRREAPAPVVSKVTKTEPPLSIAPPPEAEPKKTKSSSAARKTAKKASAADSAR